MRSSLTSNDTSLVEYIKDIYMVAKSTNAYYVHDQSDPRVVHDRKGSLEEAARAEQRIITDAAPNELKLDGGA